MTKLLKTDAERAWKKIDRLPIRCITKNDKLAFLKRFFTWIEQQYQYRYNEIFLLHEFRDYEIRRQKKKDPIVEFDAFKELYRSCDSDYYRLLFLTMFLYGFRIGEQLALTVDSFDFEAKTLEIYRAVTIKGKNGLEFVTPKTAAGQRVQPVPDSFARLVREHIARYHLKEKEFIFFRYRTHQTRENHALPVHENTCRRAMEKYCRKYNPDFHPHMLRTSICTHLREKGVPIEEISKFLGHEDPAVTEQYYSKISQNKKEAINDVIDEFMKEIV